MTKRHDKKSHKGLKKKHRVSRTVKLRRAKGGSKGRSPVQTKTRRRTPSSPRTPSPRRSSHKTPSPRRSSHKTPSPGRSSLKRSRKTSPQNRNEYEKLKGLAKHILEQYKDGYIVGSMAIALREEAFGITPTPYPNDIDIVLPVDQGVATLPHIDGITPHSGMTTKGAKFYGNMPYKGLEVDVILEEKERPEIVEIDGLGVLNIESLKSRYKDITTSWEYADADKKSALTKLVRLNKLSHDL